MIERRIYQDVTIVPQEYYASTQPKFTEPPIHYNIERFELVPYVGALTYVEGATFPDKTMHAAEIVRANNMVKEVIKQTLKHPVLFLNPTKLCRSFNAVCEKIYLSQVTGQPLYCNHIYLCLAARMVWYATSTFLQSFGVPVGVANTAGLNVAHVFEFDDGYRFRLQDMATEMNIIAFEQNPRKEILRLVKIYLSREKGAVMKKTLPPIKALLWLLYIPKVRRAVVRCSQYIKKMQFDEMDWYWASFKDMYDFGGLTHAERIKDIQIPKMYKYEMR